MANLPVEEPDALMCARPDLWERWVSNHPAPPGHPARRQTTMMRRCQFKQEDSVASRRWCVKLAGSGVRLLTCSRASDSSLLATGIRR